MLGTLIFENLVRLVANSFFIGNTNKHTLQMEERRKLGLVRFSLAMDDMRRLVDQVIICL